MNDFEWARDIEPAIQHDRLRPFTVNNIPYGDMDTKVYDKFCEFYGKEYIDNINRFNCNLFNNAQIKEGIDTSIQIWVKPKLYNFGELDETGWTESGWFHTLNDDDSFYVQPQHRYEYHQFLNMTLTDIPVWG